MFSEWAIKAMNGTTVDDQLHCEACGQAMQVFWIQNNLRVCVTCKPEPEE